MTSQSHFGFEVRGRSAWRLSRALLALALLLSFAVQVGVRASHTHRPVDRDERRATCEGHGHHHHHHHGHVHDGSRDGSRGGGQDEDSAACEICQKLTIARFTSFVGGAPVALTLAPRVAVGVPVEASWEAPNLAAPRAASRGPPTGA